MGMTKLKVNFIANFALQIFNFGFGLLSVPILLSSYDPSKWGYIAYTSVILNYVIWIVNWGYPQWTIKSFAREAVDKLSLSKDVSLVISSQLILQFFVTFVLTILMILDVHPFDSVGIYTVALISSLCTIFTPYWVYYCVSDFVTPAILQTLTKLSMVVMYVCILDGDSSIETFFYINTVSAVAVALIAIIHLSYNGYIKICYISFNTALFSLRHSALYFVSTLVSSLNNGLLVFFTGMFLTSYVVGIYSLADKVRSYAIIALHPLTSVLFPRLCSAAKDNQHLFIQFVIKIAIFLVIASVIPSVFVYLYSKYLIAFLGNEMYSSASASLKIIAPTIVFVTLTSFVFNHVLIPLGKIKTVLLCQIIIGMSTCLLAYVCYRSALIVDPAYISFAIEFFSFAIAFICLKNIYSARVGELRSAS